MSGLPESVEITPLAQDVTLKLLDQSSHHAIAMATDRSSIWFLVVGDATQDQMKPTWISDDQVIASFIGSGRR